MAPADVKMAFSLRCMLRWVSSLWTRLFVLISQLSAFLFIFAPCLLPGAYTRDPASPAQWKAVAHRVFLGPVPGCSCSTLSRGKATLGLSVIVLFVPSPFCSVPLPRTLGLPSWLWLPDRP